MTTPLTRPEPSVAPASDATRLFVVFKVGDCEYALPADDILHMESYTGATAVPGTSPFVAGVASVRGKVVPVVDLRVRFGLPIAKASLDSRLIVAQVGERTVALLADSAREVVRLAPSQLKSPPSMIAEGSTGLVRAIAQVATRVLMILDLARAIGQESKDVH